MNDITLWTRPAGPLCITDNFRESSDKFVSALLSAPLFWYWRSQRSYETADESPVKHLPIERGLTHLTMENAVDLRDDVREEVEECGYRYIEIYGLNVKPNSPDKSFLNQSARTFALSGQSALSACIIFIEDQRETYMFFPQPLTNLVTNMLAQMDINIVQIKRKRKYHQLYLATFENMFQIK